MMRLTGLLIIGISLMALADMVNAGDRFDSEVRRVDVIGQIHHQVSQMDSSKDAESVKRVDVIGKINDHAALVAGNKNAEQGTGIGVVESVGPQRRAYPYTMPMNR